MDRLLRGRAGGAVRGVAQRLRHDNGGGAHHGADPPLPKIASLASLTSPSSHSSLSLSHAESSSGEHETLLSHLQQRFLPQHVRGEYRAMGPGQSAGRLDCTHYVFS